MVKSNLSIAIVVICLSVISNRTNAQTQLITDRPDQAESAETILPGFFQIETGFLYNKNNINESGITNEIKSFDIASTLLRIGLSSVTELRIEGGFLIQETSILDINETISGLNGIGLGAKIRLVKNSDSTPSISTIINFKLPIGKNEFKSKNIEPEVILIAVKEISHALTLSTNIGTEWNSSDEILGYFYSLSLGISLTENIGTFIEYYGNSSSNISPVNKMDTGFTFLIKENIQFDISGGLDLNNGTSDWFINTGFSFRLPN